MARRARKTRTPKKAAGPKVKRHIIKLEPEAFDALKQAMNGKLGGSSFILDLLNRLEPGESEITTLHPMAFNKARTILRKAEGKEFEVKGGFFFIHKASAMAPTEGTSITRLQ